MNNQDTCFIDIDKPNYCKNYTTSPYSDYLINTLLKLSWNKIILCNRYQKNETKYDYT